MNDPYRIVIDYTEATVGMSDAEATAMIARAADKLTHVNELYDTLNTLTNELQAWESSGQPRPASWATSRIRRARAALEKVRP